MSIVLEFVLRGDVVALIVDYVIDALEGWSVAFVDKSFAVAALRVMNWRCVDFLAPGLRKKTMDSKVCLSVGAAAFRRCASRKLFSKRCEAFLVAEEPREDRPRRRFAHSTIVDRRGRLVVFGGRDSDEFMDDTWALDPFVEDRWTRLEFDGEAPRARRAHAAAYVEESDEMIIVGGGTQTESFGDVYALNFSRKNQWRQVLKIPEWTAFGHVLARVSLDDNKICFLVHGGATHDRDTGMFLAHDEAKAFFLDKDEPIRVRHEGSRPLARYRHTCTALEKKNQFLLVGGYVLHPFVGMSAGFVDRLTYCSSDVWLLDVSTTEDDKLQVLTLKWTVVDVGKQFPPRGGHAALALGNGVLVLGGGVQYTSFPPRRDDPTEEDFDSVWFLEGTKATQCDVKLPSPRGGTTAVVAPLQCQRTAHFGILIFGGRDYHHHGRRHRGRDDLAFIPMVSSPVRLTGGGLKDDDLLPTRENKASLKRHAGENNPNNPKNSDHPATYDLAAAG